MADGGYYAIKGFAFQIDKAILALLDSIDEKQSINIEHIQDINDNDFIMQVKYKESQDYADSQIKEPVIQLIEEFRKNPSKIYKLYCYFKDKSVSEEVISIHRLNAILTLSTGSTKQAVNLNSRINSFDDNLKKRFIKKFRLIFAPDYDAQFKQVLYKLQSLSFIGMGNEDLAIFYYSNIVDYFKRIIINNANPSQRSCYRKQVIEYLKKGKNLVFSSSYEEFKGNQEYFKFIKTKFVKARTNQKNLILLGDIVVDSSVSISKLIIDIVDRCFKKATYDFEPLIFILPDNLIVDVKKELLINDITFNDGFESIQFSEKIFNHNAIKTRKIVGGKLSDSLEKISFRFRLLSRSRFESINNHMQFHMIYSFDSELIQGLAACSFIKIEKLNTKQIYEMLTFQ